MAKTKKLKLKTADKVLERKRNAATKAKKINAFELHVNKKKFPVLGRKDKSEWGLPGRARSKAHKKRQETLLPEFLNKSKTNKFNDRRLGEKNPDMSDSLKMTLRAANERKRQMKKESIFNLNDDDELTHRGQSLSEVEKYERPESDSEDDQRLADEYVEAVNFSGVGKSKYKSDRDLLAELIAKTREARYERQSELKEANDQTEKLDEQFKLMSDIMAAQRRKKYLIKPEEEEKKKDDYDIMVRELMFDRRGQPTDKLKSADQLAREEKLRLERLEADRKKRMRGEIDGENVNKKRNVEKKGTHVTADDLGDESFEMESSNFMVAYKEDGSLLHKPDKKKLEKKKKVTFAEEVSEEEESEESDEEESDGSESGSDSYSDMEEEEDVSDQEGTVDNTDSSERVQRKKQVMQAARKELPYIYQAPESYDEFTRLVEKYLVEDRGTVIERLIKCHHPSLSDQNRQKLEVISTCLVQYIGELALTDVSMFTLIDKLAPLLYDLAHLIPFHVSSCFNDVISERQKEFQATCDRRQNGRGIYPNLDTLVFFKLVSLIFPTSDYRHPVTTPAMLFMGQILSQCSVNTSRDIAAGLFISNLFLEYVELPKRIVPEVVNFLTGLVYLSVVKNPGERVQIVPPFRPAGENTSLLVPGDQASSISPGTMTLSDLVDIREIDDEFRVRACYTSLELLHSFCKMYEDYSSCEHMFSSALTWSERIQTDTYPQEIGTSVRKFQSLMETVKEKKLGVLAHERKKPRPLKLYDPQIEDNFDGKKRAPGSKDMKDKQRMAYLYKREHRGAVRELRRDNRFLATHKIREQISRDAERKRKVNKLMGELATQEGECKKIDKLKAKLSGTK